MGPAGRAESEIMKTFEETLEVASAGWVGDGVITSEQRLALLQRHPAEKSGGSRFVAIVATVGAVLFAVGVSLIIKSNWEAIGDWTKIGGLVLLLIGAYAAGWRLREGARSFARTGDASIMMGQLFFLCGIALVSQIFHLNSRPASGVLLWWLGIAAMPWLTRAKGAQFISIVAGLAWFGMEMATPGSWIAVGREQAWGEFDQIVIQAVFFLLGLALWMAGLGLRGMRWADFAGMHEKCGLLLACGSLYILGFVRHHWAFGQYGARAFESTAVAALALGGLLAAAAAFAAIRSSRREVKMLGPWILLGLVPVAGIIVFGPLGDDGWLWSALAWLTLFSLSVAVTHVGLQTGREGWVNLGILFIAANIITRYFDLFGTMLDGGVFFVVTGVLVTALGIYLEKKRRALLATLRMEGAS